MDLAEQAFWDAVFLKALEAGLRAPGDMTVGFIMDASCQMADYALAERRKRIAQVPQP